MTSMLTLNCQKKSGHTEFYGVSVALFCFMADTCSCAGLQLLISRRRLCDVGTRGTRCGGFCPLSPLPLKSGMALDSLISLFESLFSKL